MTKSIFRKIPPQDLIRERENWRKELKTLYVPGPGDINIDKAWFQPSRNLGLWRKHMYKTASLTMSLRKEYTLKDECLTAWLCVCVIGPHGEGRFVKVEGSQGIYPEVIHKLELERMDKRFKTE